MSLTLVTPPALEPVSLSEMKTQLGLGPMEDTDQLREQMLAEQIRPALMAARIACENLCARAFLTQTWTMTLDRFPWGSSYYQMHDRFDIRLPLASLQAITAFTYVDAGGTSQDNMAVGAWGYQLVSGGDTQLSRLRPPVLRGWPITQPDLADAVSITFRCGFGDTPAALPWAIRTAVKVMAQWIYDGCRGTQPAAIVALLTPYIFAL